MIDKEQQRQSFDFELWSTLASENPDRFEAMRTALLEQMIEQSPVSIRRRMRGLQWRVDQIRNQAANPMSACLSISKMMWDSLLGDKGLLTALETPEKILKLKTEATANKVIPLHKEENQP